MCTGPLNAGLSIIGANHLPFYFPSKVSFIVSVYSQVNNGAILHFEIKKISKVSSVAIVYAKFGSEVTFENVYLILWVFDGRALPFTTSHLRRYMQWCVHDVCVSVCECACGMCVLVCKSVRVGGCHSPHPTKVYVLFV